MSRVLWQETCLEETADSQQTRTLAESDQAAPGRHVGLGVGGAEGRKPRFRMRAVGIWRSAGKSTLLG